MKNPNGYGTVVKLSGNRRRPYAVRKTIGYDAKRHPIYLPIGYTATREEGLIMLAEYNNNPYNIDVRKMTVKAVFEKWSELNSGKMNENTYNALKTAWKHCKKVELMKYRELNTLHMQDCIDNCGCGYSTQQSIKALFGHLDKFAFSADIIDKRYSEATTAPGTPDTKKKPFTDDEIKTLWEHKDAEWVDSVLVFLYSTWRINELLSLKKTDVDLENMIMEGGSKTRNGKHRIIPIHKKILPLIEKRMKADGEYLFSYNGRKCNAGDYYPIWHEIMNKYGMEHTPHECRHTFRSKLDSAGANKVCMDLLMGHKSKDVGERVYTHKKIEELRKTIHLLD